MDKMEYNEQEELEVTVSVTLSKTFKVNADKQDYKSLYDIVEEQIVLPQNLAEFTERIFNEHCASLKAVGIPLYLKNAIEDCKNWTVDDYIVIKE